jgi:hypothetical protein
MKERDISPFKIPEYDCEKWEPVNEETRKLISEVLKPLSTLSVAGAIHTLNEAKKAIKNCTLLHSEYF